MSWQDYVDKQLMASRCVTKAAIAGHDGNVWAKSEGFEVSFSLPWFLWSVNNKMIYNGAYVLKSVYRLC